MNRRRFAHSLGLKEIEKSAFVGLGKLKEMFLDDNQLVSFPPGIFSPLTSLREL